MSQWVLLFAFAIHLRGAYATVPVNVQPQPQSSSDLKSGALYYSQKEPFPFAKWKPSPEKHILNLFPEFRDGALNANNAKNPDSGELIIFTSQSTVVIDRPPEEIDFQSLLNPDRINEIQDGMAISEPLDPRKIETYKQDFLAYRNPSRATWCGDPAAMCLSSKLVFDEISSLFLALAMQMKHYVDSEIDLQSEIKIERKLEASQLADLKTMTRIDKPVTALITQNIFWFNHVLEYAKIVGVVQPHPSQAGKTVINGFALFCFEKKWWTFGVPMIAHVEDVAMGRSTFNSPTGLSRGLPKVTQDLVSKLAGMLTSAKSAALKP